jgi:hypothetical protein
MQHGKQILGTRKLDLLGLWVGWGWRQILHTILPVVDGSQGPTCTRGEFSPS